MNRGYIILYMHWSRNCREKTMMKITYSLFSKGFTIYNKGLNKYDHIIAKSRCHRSDEKTFCHQEEPLWNRKYIDFKVLWVCSHFDWDITHNMMWYRASHLTSLELITLHPWDEKSEAFLWDWCVDKIRSNEKMNWKTRCLPGAPNSSQFQFIPFSSF